NAKKHKDEAGIVAQAGRLGAVTIATNMAGRGTDIILGGDPEFMARSRVSEIMHETSEQIAQFAFLTGKPELINTEMLAKRDSEGLGQNIYEEKKAYYDKAVKLYAEELTKALD